MKPDIIFTKYPIISFEGKSFCFTGKFDGHERSEFEHFVKSKGALFTANVSEETDYLVIGSKGTRCCSFSCCTRVVEKAVGLKKTGARLEFIKESDFLYIFGRI